MQWIVIQEIWSIFQFSRCKISHLVKKSQYQSIKQFLIPKQRNTFLTAVKNSFNMTGIDKSRTSICYLLEIINFTNYHTWLFIRTSTFMITTFQFPEYKSNVNKLKIHIFNNNLYKSNLNKLKMHIFNNNLYVRFLKQGMYVFHFMFYILQLEIIYDGVI